MFVIEFLMEIVIFFIFVQIEVVKGELEDYYVWDYFGVLLFFDY